MHQQHITRFFNVGVCSLQPNGSPRRFRPGRDGALRSLLQPCTRGIPLKEFLHGTEDPGQSTPGTYSRFAQCSIIIIQQGKWSFLGFSL